MTIFTILPSGDIGNLHDFFYGAEWDKATHQDILQVVADMEEFYRRARVLIQAQSDLRWDPRRESDDKAEQDAYWEIFEPWYTVEAPTEIVSLLDDIDAYWQKSPGEGFKARRPHEPEYQIAWAPNIKDNVKRIYNQYKHVYAFCMCFAQSEEILPLLNPTGKGARRLAEGGQIAPGE